MIISRPSGGDFDPVSAQVYAPNRTRMDSGESAPIDASPLLVLTTRIQSPRAMFTSERHQQGHPQSVTDLVIGVRNEKGGDQLTADMWIMHRGHYYEILGRMRTDYRKGVTLYQVIENNDYT